MKSLCLSLTHSAVYLCGDLTGKWIRPWASGPVPVYSLPRFPALPASSCQIRRGLFPRFRVFPNVGKQGRNKGEYSAADGWRESLGTNRSAFGERRGMEEEEEGDSD